MRLYGWKTFSLSHYPAKLHDLKNCSSGDKTFLICHMTSQDHTTKRSRDLMGAAPHCISSPVKFDGQKHCSSGDILFIYHIVKGLIVFIGWEASL